MQKKKGGRFMTDLRSQEQAYLHLVYQELLQAQASYQAVLADTIQSGQELLAEFGHDAKLKFDSYAENLETLAMLEMKNREIDQWNLKNQATAKALEKVERLLQVPYFGKIVLTFADTPNEQEAFYIGVNNFTSLEANTRIHDWRSPITSLFYNNILGATQYSVNQTAIPVDLHLKRQLIIEKDQLINFFDTDIAIQDDVLLQTLEADSSEYMKEITTTIQQEQNEIIREEQHSIILVNGIAGSGKTSVIMQRIAYLLYQNRSQITADNILLLSPNSTFIDYISQVLPNLGERNPLNLTLLQFLRFTTKEQLPIETETTFFQRIAQENITEQAAIIRSQEFISFLLEHQAAPIIKLDFFQPITYKKQVLFSAETIYKLYQETPENLTIRKRLAATKEKLNSLWQRTLRKQAQSKQMIDQFQQLTEAEQIRYFGMVLTEEHESRIEELALARLRKKYRKATQAIQNNTWFEQWKLFEYLFQLYSQRAYSLQNEVYSADEVVALLWIKHLFVEDLANQQMAFILIDEVQDYTPAQLLLFFTIFPKASFTLAGDENQAIFNTALDFAGIKKLLNYVQKKTAAYQLLNSYRSSQGITQLFQTLVNNADDLQIVPIRAEGQQPQLHQCKNEADYLKALSEIISADTAAGKKALVTKNISERDQLSQQLADILAQHSQWQVLSIDMAKGLEFDSVIIHDPSRLRYPGTDRDQKILYTAVSRAMKQIYLPYIQQPSPLLFPYLQQHNQN
jgi:DNA helicase-2/ATP-dependent DNA helicase PcrA